MNEHLTSAMLNALVDGELAGEQLADVQAHLASCSQCTAEALAQSLLKRATARGGQRYAAPDNVRARLERLTAEPGARSFSGMGWIGSVAAALLVCLSLYFMQRTFGRDSVAAAEFAGLVTEVCDQHVATLAANAPPEVVSSDRHTVKPWFQGKIPFSFNLPQDLPEDVTLDGANLTYVRNQPAAQLLFSIGKHRVSVFVRQRMGSATGDVTAERDGFNVSGFRTGNLDVVAVSDVEAGRLADLVHRMEVAQR